MTPRLTQTGAVGGPCSWTASGEWPTIHGCAGNECHVLLRRGPSLVPFGRPLAQRPFRRLSGPPPRLGGRAKAHPKHTGRRLHEGTRLPFAACRLARARPAEDGGAGVVIWSNVPMGISGETCCSRSSGFSLSSRPCPHNFIGRTLPHQRVLGAHVIVILAQVYFECIGLGRGCSVEGVLAWGGSAGCPKPTPSEPGVARKLFGGFLAW